MARWNQCSLHHKTGIMQKKRPKKTPKSWRTGPNMQILQTEDRNQKLSLIKSFYTHQNEVVAPTAFPISDVFLFYFLNNFIFILNVAEFNWGFGAWGSRLLLSCDWAAAMLWLYKDNENFTLREREKERERGRASQGGKKNALFASLCLHLQSLKLEKGDLHFVIFF